MNKKEFKQMVEEARAKYNIMSFEERSQWLKEETKKAEKRLGK